MREIAARGALSALLLLCCACPHDFSRALPDGAPDGAGDDRGADAEQTCTVGLSWCEGACVDLMTSYKHCGLCGQSCGDGLDCVGGRCVCKEDGRCYGCCAADVCVPIAQQSAATCGAVGASCRSCDDDGLLDVGIAFLAFPRCSFSCDDRTDYPNYGLSARFLQTLCQRLRIRWRKGEGWRHQVHPQPRRLPPRERPT